MYTVKKNLQDAYNQLENIIKMLDRKLSSKSVRIQEITMRSNIEDLLLTMVSSLKECVQFESKEQTFSIERNRHLAELTTKAYQDFENLIKDKPVVDNSSDVTTEEYHDLLNEFYKKFNLSIEMSGSKASFFTSRIEYDYETKMDEVWDGSADFLEFETIKSILALIEQPKNRQFSFLDINVGSAKNYLTMCDIFEDKAEMYGVSNDSYSYLSGIKKAREKSKRVIINGLKNTTISNDSFDVTLAFASIDMTDSSSSYSYSLFSIPPEQYYARKAFTYTRPGGIVMYAIPFTRLSKGICVDLARYLENIHAYIWQNEYDSCGMVLIVGNKKLCKTKLTIGDRGIDSDVYKMLREIVLDPDKYKVTNEIDDKFSLPIDKKDINIFRSSKLEDFELLEMVQNSAAIKEFWKKQSTEKISEHKRRSLLPFNTGQIGLVLTSGCLDGVINEGNGCSHIIKGRVIKMKDEQHVPDPENHVVVVSEKTSNRVEINAFLPNGEYKRLA